MFFCTLEALCWNHLTSLSTRSGTRARAHRRPADDSLLCCAVLSCAALHYARCPLRVFCSCPVEEVFECDCLLNATGRVPNVFGVGLDEAGVEYNNRQGVVIDDYFRYISTFLYLWV